MPFIYRVRRVRDGGSYCLRTVDVYQNAEGQSAKDPWRVVRDSKTPCFFATVSFKREEKNSERTVDFGHQDAPSDHIKKSYAKVLDGIPIADHPRSPSADAQWWIDHLGERWIEHAETLPGLEIRKVDMKAYNGVMDPGGAGRSGDYRQLCFYRVIQEEGGSIPSDTAGQSDADTDAVNLNACAHLYASDRNSLFLIQRALGFEKRQTSAGSLAHNVIVHGSPRNMHLEDVNGKAKWFVQEAWTSNSGEGRGCHESRLWDFEAGRILATTVQDGMMRVPKADYVASKRDGKL